MFILVFCCLYLVKNLLEAKKIAKTIQLFIIRSVLTINNAKIDDYLMLSCRKNLNFQFNPVRFYHANVQHPNAEQKIDTQRLQSPSLFEKKRLKLEISKFHDK